MSSARPGNAHPSAHVQYQDKKEPSPALQRHNREGLHERKMNVRDTDYTARKTDDNLRTLLLQQAILKALKEIHDKDRADTAEAFRPGERLTITAGNGIPMGMVYRNAPKPTIVGDDPFVLLAEAGDDGIEEFISPEDMDEAVKFLSNHAEHLVSLRVKPSALKLLEARAQKAFSETGEVPPGYRRKDGAATFVVRVDPALLTRVKNDLCPAAAVPALTAAMSTAIEDGDE